MAIKVLKPLNDTSWNQFKGEMYVMELLRDMKNVVEFFGVYIDPETKYYTLVTEFIDMKGKNFK